MLNSWTVTKKIPHVKDFFSSIVPIKILITDVQQHKMCLDEVVVFREQRF